MIVFANPGLIDLSASLIMGINAKEGPQPFGFFGTGLKYSLATLLRLGCSITIWRGLERIDVTTREITTRGKTFHQLQIVRWRFDASGVVPVQGEPENLGFTTDLGKTWEPWQAYRELYTNAKDEGGGVIEIDDSEEEFVGSENTTAIVVRGAAINKVHAERAWFILEGKPDHITAAADIFERPARGIFYRGILIYTPEGGLSRTWNLKKSVDLSEDRLAKYEFQLEECICSAVDELADCGKRDLVEAIVCPSGSFPFEGQIDFNGVFDNAARSKGFIEIVGEVLKTRETEVNSTAKEAFKRLAKIPELVPSEMTLTPVQRKMLDKAIDFCGKIGFDVDSYPIVPVERFGAGVLGGARNGKIFISLQAFEYGCKVVAGTLIEEFIHLKHSLKDETRGLQEFLLNRLVSLGEEMTGEVL